MSLPSSPKLERIRQRLTDRALKAVRPNPFADLATNRYRALCGCPVERGPAISALSEGMYPGPPRPGPPYRVGWIGRPPATDAFRASLPEMAATLGMDKSQDGATAQLRRVRPGTLHAVL
jgi:hypothetical protein